MKVAIPIEEERGVESLISENFLLSPYYVIVSPKDEGLEVNLYENVAKSDRELAEVLYVFKVNKVVYPSATNKVKLAFSGLGIEVIDKRYSTLEEALNDIF